MFHVEVPGGVTTLEADYDYLSPASGEGFSAGPSADPVFAVLEWNLVALYPAGAPSGFAHLSGQPAPSAGLEIRNRLPSVQQQGPGEILFAPVSLTTLVDSPVLAGRIFPFHTLLLPMCSRRTT